MLHQVDDALPHAMSGIELSRVRTELRLLLPEAYQQKSDDVERADIVMQSSGFAERHLSGLRVNQGLWNSRVSVIGPAASWERA